ncbi:hypothetical protein T03_8852 [Trichinella britovi]|uniref:Uncharacterized protein n=1 Tax=Trichinella britovi TaxID=45882 RepID=A0A0V1C859_TRIBR|nr:hypothetical protein T03_8852 [Trichinella britovi]
MYTMHRAVSMIRRCGTDFPGYSVYFSAYDEVNDLLTLTCYSDGQNLKFCKMTNNDSREQERKKDWKD